MSLLLQRYQRYTLHVVFFGLIRAVFALGASNQFRFTSSNPPYEPRNLSTTPSTHSVTITSIPRTITSPLAHDSLHYLFGVGEYRGIETGLYPYLMIRYKPLTDKAFKPGILEDIMFEYGVVVAGVRVINPQNGTVRHDVDTESLTWAISRSEVLAPPEAQAQGFHLASRDGVMSLSMITTGNTISSREGWATPMNTYFWLEASNLVVQPGDLIIIRLFLCSPGHHNISNHPDRNFLLYKKNVRTDKDLWTVFGKREKLRGYLTWNERVALSSGLGSAPLTDYNITAKELHDRAEWSLKKNPHCSMFELAAKSPSGSVSTSATWGFSLGVGSVPPIMLSWFSRTVIFTTSVLLISVGVAVSVWYFCFTREKVAAYDEFEVKSRSLNMSTQFPPATIAEVNIRGGPGYMGVPSVLRRAGHTVEDA